MSLKKILFISLNDHVPWGGSEVLWSKTAQNLLHGFKINILVKKWLPEPEQIKTLKKGGAKIHYKQDVLRVKNSSFFSKIGQKFLPQPPIDHKLNEIIDEERFDLIVISLGNSVDTKIPFYCNFFRRQNLPYVLLVQLATDLRSIGDNLMTNFRVSYENALKVYFLSKENKEKTEMQLAVNLLNYEFINNPFYFAQDYLGYENDSNYTLGFVASFTTFHKGQDLLIKVLSQNKWKRRNIVINLYGEGSNRRQIEGLIRKYGLQDMVYIKGFRSNITEVWQENMVCIMTSRMEGQSLAMLEALSHGRMVISTKVGDAERLIEDEKTGFLIPAATVELIDKTLEKAWNRREEWLRMGELSRERLFEIIKKEPIADFSERLSNLLS